jgi:tetratricopeptide (TPR) repeat protein
MPTTKMKNGDGESYVSKRFAKTLLGVSIVAAMGLGTALAQAPVKEKQVKDQAEWNLFNDSTKTADPAKRLGFLNTWKEKYPESDFKDARLLIYLTTYQALNQPAKMVETAKEILAMNPKEPHALLALTMLTSTYPNPPTADSLDTGEKAAQTLLTAEKPAEVKDEATWKKIKTDEAHKAVIFIAMQRKQPEAAEQEYAKWLAEDPNQAQVSYSLGNTILAEKKQERYSEMLYHWARAASLTGPGALPEPQRKQVDAYFVKQYNAIHGPDEAGLKELRALAVSQPMPAAGFKIKTKNEIDAEQQEKLVKDNPQLALWKGIKDALLAANGEQYFEGTLKGSAVPKLKGKLVSMKPAVRPKELVLAIDTPNTPEVTLKFENPLPGKAEPGTEIEFEAVPTAFAKDPFMLTFDVEGKDKIHGWPAQAAAPARNTISRNKK